MSSDVNAAATLSLAIDTNGAEFKLKELAAAYTDLRASLSQPAPAGGVAAVGVGAKEAEGRLKALEAELSSLQAKLTETGNKAKEAGKTISAGLQAGAGSIKLPTILEDGQLANIKSRFEGLGQESAKAFENGLTNNNFGKYNQALKLLEQNTAGSLKKVQGMITEAQRWSGAFGPATASVKFGDAFTNGELQGALNSQLREKAVSATKAEAAALVEEANAAKAAARALEQEAAAIAKATAAKERDILKSAKFSTSSLSSQLGTVSTIQAAASNGATPTSLKDTFGSTAVNLASNAQAVKELESAHAKARSAVTEHTVAQKGWNAAADEAHALARGLSGAVGGLWMTYGSMVPLMAGAALAGGFKSAMEAGSKFEYQLTFVKALGGETAESVGKIGEAALTLSKTSLYGPVELANGLRILSQAGISARDSLFALPAVLNLATVGEMNMEQAAITLAGVMNAFSLQVTDMNHIGDVFAKAAAVSQTSVVQMTEAMKTASVVGEQYGASMEDTATALTLLAKVNITGTAAGTSLRNMLKDMYAPSKQQELMFKMMGVSAKDAVTGGLRPFVDVIFDLRKELSKYDSASQAVILRKMFDERGAKEAMALLGQTKKDWDELQGKITNSDGFSSQVSAALEMTTAGRFKQAMNTLQVDMVEAFEGSAGGARKLSDALRDLFDSSSFKTALSGMVSAMGTLLNAVVTLMPAIIGLGTAFAVFKTLGWVVAGIEALSVGMTALSVSVGVVSSVSAFAGGGMQGLSLGLRALSAEGAVAAGAMGTAGLAGALALLTNPLTWAVVALGGLAYALYATSKATDPAVEASKNFTDELDRQIKKLKDTNAALDDQIAKKRELAGLDNGLSPIQKQRNDLEAKIASTRAGAFGSTSFEYGDELSYDPTAGKQKLLAQLEGQLKHLNEAEKMISAQTLEILGKGVSEQYAERKRQLDDIKIRAKDDGRDLNPAKLQKALQRMEEFSKSATPKDQADRRVLMDKALSELAAGDKVVKMPESPGAMASAEKARALLDFRDAMKMADMTYGTNATLLDERLKGGLVSYREYQEQRAALDADYSNKIGDARLTAERAIASDIGKVDKAAQKLQLQNAIDGIKDQEKQRKAAHVEEQRKALGQVQIKTEIFAKDTIAKDIPALEAKEGENRRKEQTKFANRNLPADQLAAEEARNRVIGEYAPKLAAANAMLEENLRLSGLDSVQTKELTKQKADLIAAMSQEGSSPEAMQSYVDSLALVTSKLDGQTVATQKLREAQEALIKSRDKQAAASAENAADLSRQQNQFKTGWEDAYASWERSTNDSAAAAKSIFTKTVDGMTDTIASFLTTGKANFGTFVADVMKMMLKMQIQETIKPLMGKDGLGSLVGVVSNWLKPAVTTPAAVNTGDGTTAALPMMGDSLKGLGVKAADFLGLSKSAKDAAGATSTMADAASSASTDGLGKLVASSAATVAQDATRNMTQGTATQAAVSALLALASAANAASVSMGGSPGGAGGIGSMFGGMSSSAGASAGSGAAEIGSQTALEELGYSFFANGGVASGPSISAYSNQIVDKPTYFAKGGNVMGEAGPEVIMPISRDAQGRMGVRVAGGSADNTQGGVSINITVNEGDGSSQKSSSGDTQNSWTQFAEKVRSMILQEMMTQKRPGGMMAS